MYLKGRIVCQHIFVLCLLSMIVHLTLCERSSFSCLTNTCEIDAVVGQDIEILFQFMDTNLTDFNANTTYLVLFYNKNKNLDIFLGLTKSSSAEKSLTFFKERRQTGKIQIKDVTMNYAGEYRVEIQENNTVIYHIVNISINVYPRDTFETPKCSVSPKSSNDMVQLNCQWNTTRFKGEAWIMFGKLKVTTQISRGERGLSYYTSTKGLTDPPPSCIVSRLGIVKTCNFSSVNYYHVTESMENSVVCCSNCTIIAFDQSIITEIAVSSPEPQKCNVYSKSSIPVLVMISCSLTILFTTSVCIYVSCSKFILSKCGKSGSSTEFNSPLNQNQSLNDMSEQDVELQAVSLHLKDQMKDEKKNHGSDMLRDTNFGRSNQRQPSQGISEEAVSKRVSRKQERFASGPPCVRPKQSTVGYAFDNVEYFDLGDIANYPEQQMDTSLDGKVDLPDNIYSDVEYFQNGCCSVPPDMDNANSRECLAERSPFMGCGNSQGKGCDPLNKMYAKVDRNKDRDSRVITNPSCDADNSSPSFYFTLECPEGSL